MSKTSIAAWIGVMFILVLVPAILIQDLTKNPLLTILGIIMLTILVFTWISTSLSLGITEQKAVQG